MPPQLLVHRRRRVCSSSQRVARKPRQLKKRRHRKTHINRKHRRTRADMIADKKKMKSIRMFIGKGKGRGH
jgi:hypothetical protein